MNSAGHIFAGLVMPWEIWQHPLGGISMATKQIIAMGVGGFFGFVLYWPYTMLVYRLYLTPKDKSP